MTGTALPYWRLSTFYFAYFALLGGLAPYWSVYLDALGYSGQAIGVLMALLTGTKIVAPNVWGWIADRQGSRLRIIRFGAFATTIVFCGLLVRTDFWWMAAVVTLFSFFWNAILSQFEVITLGHLGERTSRYSRIRLWGSVGFIVTVAGLGWLFDRYPVTNLPWVLLPVILLIWLSTVSVGEEPLRRTEEGGAGFLVLLRRREAITFFVACFLLQVSHGPYYTFFSLFLDLHGYNRTSIGLLWSLGVIAEIVLFLGMHRILPRVGVRGLVLAALVLTTMRWWLIGCYADNLPVLLFAQCLHAFSFGAFHAAAIDWVHRYFGARHAGKGQALYSSASFGAGSAVGALLSGVLWDAAGPVTAYAVAAWVAALCLLIVYAGFREPSVGQADLSRSRA